MHKTFDFKKYVEYKVYSAKATVGILRAVFKM